METSVKERLKLFLRELNIKGIDFCSSIGVSSGFISGMRESIQPDKLKSIAINYPELNIGWLMTGQGKMLNSEELAKSDKASNATNQHGLIPHAIKYYPSVNGSMGGVEFLDNPNESSVDIVIPGFSDCKFAVNAYGDSMYPIIKSGQIVVMMEWKESFIDWGRIYFVVTKNGYRAIKYLKPSEKEGYIKCESENATGNPAFDVEINDIHRLFLVKGWICREAI